MQYQHEYNTTTKSRRPSDNSSRNHILSGVISKFQYRSERKKTRFLLANTPRRLYKNNRSRIPIVFFLTNTMMMMMTTMTTLVSPDGIKVRRVIFSVWFRSRSNDKSFCSYVVLRQRIRRRLLCTAWPVKRVQKHTLCTAAKCQASAASLK